MQAPEDRYIKIGEINTRYWSAGDTGPRVVLIHGVGRFIEEWLPDGRLRILEDCGHLPMLENTRMFNDSILNFLGS